ncbi:hypothetical protein EDB86DRAFT_326867 [Lactarius hatsudake]|nr:hypothetical protein EDB86DRAFT_326867 [Lactarius hatsudake]
MPEDTVPPDYAAYVCYLFASSAFVAPVLFSAGNNGVGGGDCLFQDIYGNSRVHFQPTFPSTCPWVTSIGRMTGYNPKVAATFRWRLLSVFSKAAVPEQCCAHLPPEPQHRSKANHADTPVLSLAGEITHFLVSLHLPTLSVLVRAQDAF